MFAHLVDLSVVQDHVELYHELLGGEVIIDLIIVVIGGVIGDHGGEDRGIGTGGGAALGGLGTMLQSTGVVD